MAGNVWLESFPTMILVPEKRKRNLPVRLLRVLMLRTKLKRQLQNRLRRLASASFGSILQGF